MSLDIYKKAIENVNNNNYLSAIEYYKKLLEETHNITEKNKYLYEFGNVYEKIQKYYNAIVECYILIIKTEPYNGVVLNQIGVCYFNLGQYKLAIHYFKKVLKIKDIFDVQHNIGVCYENMRDYESAETTFFNCYQSYKSYQSYNYKILYSLANVYYINKQYSKAIEFYKKITDYEKNFKIKYFSSFSYLAQKNFKLGFELYENRTYFNDVNPQTKLYDRLEIPGINLWNGRDKCNKLLIVAEQGLGDNIQYYRFIVELSELYPDMIIHFFCKKEISHLFKKYNNIEIYEHN
jgi:tetratricopeptide (TPR) repeat protein